MKVKFLVKTSFRGKKYKKGAVEDLPQGVALRLVAVSQAKAI